MRIDSDETESQESYSDKAELNKSYRDKYDSRESSDVDPFYYVEAESYLKLESIDDTCEWECGEVGNAEVHSIVMGCTSKFLVEQAVDLFLSAPLQMFGRGIQWTEEFLNSTRKKDIPHLIIAMASHFPVIGSMNIING